MCILEVVFITMACDLSYNILLEEPEIIDIDGMTIQERYHHMLNRFNDNFLRTDIILWKNKTRRLSSYIEEGWVFVPDVIPPHENYLKYLVETMKENICMEEKEGWVRAGAAGFSVERELLLSNIEFENKENLDYWIDPRLLGGKWRGLFESTRAQDEIIEVVCPPAPP